MVEVIRCEQADLVVCIHQRKDDVGERLVGTCRHHHVHVHDSVLPAQLVHQRIPQLLQTVVCSVSIRPSAMDGFQRLVHCALRRRPVHDALRQRLCTWILAHPSSHLGHARCVGASHAVRRHVRGRIRSSCARRTHPARRDAAADVPPSAHGDVSQPTTCDDVWMVVRRNRRAEVRCFAKTCEVQTHEVARVGSVLVHCATFASTTRA
mmetsp:Transcript_8010/g.49484  ORF Transcript_8010/g.49484 Transcript_8010/m.49484 type:complete len:208 (-) Transcript_8010:482-1105(-)